MRKIKLKTFYRKLLADTLTPVNIYLKLRDVFAGSILLESSDYHGQENSLSYICCQPLASFEVNQDRILVERFGEVLPPIGIDKAGVVIETLEQFRQSFIPDATVITKFPNTGLFGYMAYDAVRYFEDVPISRKEVQHPELLYKLYQYVIVVDHFSNEISLLETTKDENRACTLGNIEQLIFSNRFSTYSFHRSGAESSNFSNEEFLETIEQAKQHCYRGDVFQLVLSRRFQTAFTGDEFNVYRALRSINPSPYLFYFDFGSFKVFGSSPEAQLQVKGKQASIFPIAGTFKRTGNDQEDAALAAKLSADEKENAEHIMLVDLARNDMSRHAQNVGVEVFKEIQYYSHVIHLVSKISGSLNHEGDSLQMAADTFPAGTLSGAPKHMAMTLINRYEPVNRGFYGGAIGLIGFDGAFNHAIMIRTFLSKANRLTYQAGAGIVAKSQAKNELQEVNNKLEALRKALQLAEAI